MRRRLLGAFTASVQYCLFNLGHGGVFFEYLEAAKIIYCYGRRIGYMDDDGKSSIDDMGPWQEVIHVPGSLLAQRPCAPAQNIFTRVIKCWEITEAECDAVGPRPSRHSCSNPIEPVWPSTQHSIVWSLLIPEPKRAHSCNNPIESRW